MFHVDDYSAQLECWIHVTSDCNPGGFGIDKFVISGSRFGIRLTDWSSFCFPPINCRTF